MSENEHRTAVDELEFRRTMGQFATGVAVLAVRAPDGEIIGMTANAITSVSLDPMLVLICVDKRANICRVLEAVDRFTLSFLSETQEPLSHYFAGLWNPEMPAPGFNFSDWEGGPRLAGTLGAVGCRHYDILDGGDHWIVLGEVTHTWRADDGGMPLIFFGGGYHRLADAG